MSEEIVSSSARVDYSIWAALAGPDSSTSPIRFSGGIVSPVKPLSPLKSGPPRSDGCAAEWSLALLGRGYS
eukprot:6296867-Pyramimonas_sp.AAC.1